MPEQNAKNIRIPVKGEAGKHTNHKIRTIVISQDKGIKALYCVTDKKIITYIFAKAKNWTMAKAKEWVAEHSKTKKILKEIHVDQMDEFMKISATNEDGSTEEYLPNSPSFIMNEDIAEETMGYEEKGEGTEIIIEKEIESSETIEVIKVDKVKQIVYGAYLVPEKADHDGDVISAEDIEKVAHKFLVDYRTVDEMHKTVIAADIVESSIAWVDNLDYFGKKLKKGTWFGAIKIHDRDVWNKVVAGDYKAFSVRIAGVREPIEKES